MRSLAKWALSGLAVAAWVSPPLAEPVAAEATIAGALRLRIEQARDRGTASTVSLAAPRHVEPPIAVPLVLADPTPRSVQVQIDENFFDYAATGGFFGDPIIGRYSSDGVTGSVSLAGTAVEAWIDAIFADLASALSGTFSTYDITIDVASGQVFGAVVNGRVNVPGVGNLPLAQAASSAQTAGFQKASVLGIELPLFCLSGAGCTIVPGQAYEPATGTLNAVGAIESAANFFSPFGELKLSEALAFCDLETDKPIYGDGEQTVLTTFRFANQSGAELDARLRLQFNLPSGQTRNLLDLGADGTFHLPSGANFDIGPLPLLTVQPGFPRGEASYRCAVEDPGTGALRAEDSAVFQLQ